MTTADSTNRSLRFLLELGRGGMGVVYLALEQGPGGFAKLKVIKRLRSDLSEEPAAVRSFLEEGRLSARLHHPNVVQTNAVGFDGKHHFLEMEYLEGQSLAALVRRASRGRGLRIPIAVHVLAQTLAGLHYAHELKELDGTDLALVHRDVSPHNVFVTYDGQVKLLDFGIARAAGSSSETKTGFLKGKVTYMAPEQVARQPLDRRVDLFAVGVMLWESLAGQRLWGEMDDFEIFLKLRSDAIPSPRTVRPDVPEALEAVCMRALARDPAARFATALEMQRELESWLESSGERVGAKELAATMEELFAADRAATKAEVEQQMRATPVAGSTAGVPMLHAAAVTGGTAPGVGTEPREGTRVREQRRVRGLQALTRGAIGIALVASLAAVAVTWRARRAKTSAAVAVVEPGMSKNAEAMAAYRAGMQALRDADREGATRQFDRAIALDADFPAAHLRRGLVSMVLFEEERVHLREAIRLRARLGDHDRSLLDAFTPRASVPEDATETEHRLERAFAAAPADADFALQLCRARNYSGAYEGARETCARATELDPEGAMATRETGMALEHLGDEDGARAAFERCLRASPLAISCSQPLVQLDAYGGHCADALTNVRRMISANRAESGDYLKLASLLLATGESVESARLALDLEVQHTPGEGAPLARTQTAVFLAIFTGDFVEADRQLGVWNDAVASSQDEVDHFDPAVTRVTLAEEEGKNAEATSLATDYLRRRATWTLATDEDRSIFLVGKLYRLGAVARPEFVEKRRRWLEARRAQRGNAFGSGAWFTWIAAYASTAVTSADAREALEVLPQYLPLPDPSLHVPDFELPIGHTYRLAGRAREALPYLSIAAGSCFLLGSPFEIIESNLELGLAKEDLSDRAGACDAYRVVVQRWGGARRSVTASRAATRMRALRCE